MASFLKTEIGYASVFLRMTPATAGFLGLNPGDSLLKIKQSLSKLSIDGLVESEIGQDGNEHTIYAKLPPVEMIRLRGIVDLLNQGVRVQRLK